jgi:8-oxo-dGTP diphosphatase
MGGLMKTFHKYALCIIRDNRLLVQEEEDHDLYLMPGGRPEAGESPEATLVREIKEELGVDLLTETLRFIGSFEDKAAGPVDARIHMELYTGDFRGELRPCSEVKRLVWFAASDDWNKLAPITRNKILPALMERKLIT